MADSYNKNMKTKAIRGLVNSGADLMKNMYDIKIFFPSSSGSPEASAFSSYPVATRAKGFKIPDVDVETHDISYHGITLKMPSTKINMDREFELTFREDAAFGLRARFTAWHAAVVDPVSGGVSNCAQFFGKVEVATVASAYYATSIATSETSIEGQNGEFTGALSSTNPLLGWIFYNVWIKKVNGIDFDTGSADPNEFGVTFEFMDYDAPYYLGNEIDCGLDDTWNATASS